MCRFTTRNASRRRGIEPSVGSVGDSYDNALAETVDGLFKTEVVRRREPWRSLEAVEFATLEGVDWFNNRRLLEPIGNIPSAEAEDRYYAQLQEIALATSLKPGSLRQTRSGSLAGLTSVMRREGRIDAANVGFCPFSLGRGLTRHCASSRGGAVALMSLTGAERARLRERQRAGEKPVRFRRPKDQRSRPQRWKEAVGTLVDCLDAYQNWRDNLPAGVADSALAERLDTVLELRDLVEQLEAAELLGRD